jgi:NADPH-dependent 2,4-dienoyl-CoA reductase/sulfur reductase-like enzyme
VQINHGQASSHTFDILIIGAGPAGMAAAVAAASKGITVGVVDDNPTAGGQIWRGESPRPSTPEAAAWFRRIRESRFDLISATQVLGPLEPGILLADANGQAAEFRFDRLILATGARELFLPFPGWTLPNVLGAGGLQAMVKAGLPIEGKKVVVAGSGPLLLAVAAYLKKRGADVRLVAEQAPLGRLAGFGLGLWREPAKIRQAIGLKLAMGGIRFKARCWPVEAEGKETLASVTLTDGRSTWREPCDYLACGFGLVPNIELPLALGCTISKGFVGVDGSQRTSIPKTYAAGEITGIGGLDLSLVEGQIAGHSAAGDEVKARELFPRRERARRFARGLDRAFALRDELHALPRRDTIVCRCEDVTHGALVPFSSWVDAKLQTRCGMGACQGRICGAAAGVLYGWTRTSVRPPIFPTDLGHLARRTLGPVHGTGPSSS